jgi:hypothetical protein
MMILRLWAALRQPRYDKHPIFRRILLEPDRRIRPPRRVLVGVGGLFGMMLLCLLTFVIPSAQLGPYAVLPLVLPVLFAAFALGGTGKGIVVASSVSRAIGQEYEQDTFQTLATLPGGKLGAYWMILTAFVHRNGDLENTHEFQKQITGIAFALASFFLLILYLNTWTDLALGVFINSLFVLYPLVVIYYIDYVCAFITSALIGAMAASMTHRRLEARLTSVTTFLLVQFGTLALTYYLAAHVAPPLIEDLAFNIWVARLTLAGGSVIVYVLLREIIVWLLWWGLGTRLGARVTEQEAIFNL